MSAVLFDVNIWIALAFDSHPHHAVAKDEFEGVDSTNPAVFCSMTQFAFLRLITNPSIQKCYGTRLITNNDAWQTWERLMELPQVGWLDETGDLNELWSRYARLNSASPKVWMDAWLAAFAASHKITLVTLDHDFSNYENVSVRYPSKK